MEKEKHIKKKVLMAKIAKTFFLLFAFPSSMLTRGLHEGTLSVETQIIFKENDQTENVRKNCRRKLDEKP